MLALTEYGGYSLPVPSHTWSYRSFGYKAHRTRDELIAALERLHTREIVPAVERGLGATVYTQLSDVEEEINGLVTYDRRFVKVPEDVMRAINDRLRAASAGAPAASDAPDSAESPGSSGAPRKDPA